MQKINTAISSNFGRGFQMLGSRICERCGTKVPIIKVKTDLRDEEVTHCLACENNKLQQNYQQQYDHIEENKNAAIFKKYSMIPDDIKQARFATYKANHTSQHEAKRIAMSYEKNFKDVKEGKYKYHSLLFQGSYGVGKSHLAYSIAENLVQKGNFVIFIDAPQFLQFLRDNMFSKEVAEYVIMNVISKADLLVLDDLGAEYVKKDFGKESWAVDKLFQVFSMRNNKPKIITTNYAASDLVEKYGTHGGRIISRMMMGTKAVSLEGPDYRLNNL